MLRHAVALVIAGLSLAACGGTSGRSPDSYFGELAPAMRASHDDLGAHRATWSGMDDARLSAAYDAYGERLEDFAVDLDAIEPATKARDAHGRLAVATRALAIIYGDRSEGLAGAGSGAGSGAGTSAPADFDGREERRSSEWFNACHDLQDLALVEGLDVDLLCVTMLHSNEE